MPTLKPTKKFKMFSLVSLAYLIFIISLGISYAYLSSNLQITGVASIDGYVWPEGVLPTEPVETTEGTQFSTTFQSNYLTGNNISSSAQSRFRNIEESFDVSTSTYRMQITKTYRFGQSFNRTTESFNLNFTIKNSSNETWTNGEVVSSYTSNGNLLSNVSGSIDKTTLEAADTATLNMQFTLVIYGSFGGTVYNDQITYKINYLVGEEVRTTTVIINFICA